MQGIGLLSAGIALMPKTIFGESRRSIKHAIPSSGERIPVIGMGTSRTFDVGDNPVILTQLGQVLRVFFDNGGAVIDSSPMYGSS
jgi:aryl-alcohol dehydrogenase-like predicted oxidoreductase